MLYAEEGVPAAAIDILEQAKTVAPASYELAFNLAGAYLLKGEPARALEAYDEALGLKPDSLAALRQAAAVAESERAAGAIALVLDARQEARAGRSARSSSVSAASA